MIADFDPSRVAAVRLPSRATTRPVLAIAAGVLLLAIGAVLNPARTLHAWLAAFSGFLTIGLGALVLLMIVHAMNASWPIPIRRIVERVASTLFALVIAFVPIAIFVGSIYAWVHPAERLPPHARELVLAKAPWLQVGFFLARATIYWSSWLVAVWLLLRWSRRQDASADPAWRVRQRALSAGMLPLIGLTLTFAAFDWMMSLDPVWFSTIYGLDVFAGGFEAAIGLVTVLVVAFDRRGLLTHLVSESHYYALGRLLLAFVIFWGYIVFFQFFLIWMAHRPEEVEYYLRRLDHGWWVVATLLVLGHFVVPFFALLSYRLKRTPSRLAFVGGWLVAMHFLDMHWKIVPALDGAAIVHVADLGAILAVGGGCTLWFVRRFEGLPVAPRLDPMLPKGAGYFSD